MTDLIHLMGIVGVERAVERRSMRRPRAKFVSVLCSPIPCRLLNARAARLPFIPLPSPVRPSMAPSMPPFYGSHGGSNLPQTKGVHQAGPGGSEGTPGCKILGLSRRRHFAKCLVRPDTEPFSATLGQIIPQHRVGTASVPHLANKPDMYTVPI